MAQHDETDDGPEAGDGESGEFVRALARGLAVIEAFDQQHSRLTLTEVARRTGVSRATARRLLHTLTTLGYAAQIGREFTLRPKVLSLGLAYVSSFSLTSLARPYMEELVEAVHESCSISVLDGTEIVYVARVPAKRIMSIDIGVGTRLPAVTTSMGRVLLAALPEDELDRTIAASRSHLAAPTATRRAALEPDALRQKIRDCARQGWAMVDQELEDGLRSVAVPIHGQNGAVVAAMNLGTHAALVPQKRLLGEYLPALQRAAEAISRAMRLT
ncbi:Pca regulon regulatory protein PcaR [Rhodovulum sp. PH10]|uniref:IclR family transcriptional regulator domain-containing protein n=1 Tax=Rhodovulum sp. PH10 TaxID=1187851 RepID=UPI00027C267F|nr:IclR family transcriptional regulator C-terminal domain-containing protein [Rhodovulum sp. PH10]EJW11350.1 Pca regulon regulatory protein PcaR [Rhodovulum sp. PH10]